jgi:cytochrome c55X
MKLEGGLGPALTPAGLAGRSPEAVALVITHGRAERAMPAWRPLLSARDIDWIARGLLHGRFVTPEAR